MSNKISDSIPTSLFLLAIVPITLFFLLDEVGFDSVGFVEELPFILKFILAPIAGGFLLVGGLIIPFYIIQRLQKLGLSEGYAVGLFLVLALILKIFLTDG